MKLIVKGNVVISALLFLLVSNSAFARWPISDTIIIDGETIYIEKNYVDMDSIAKATKNDVRKKPVSNHPFGAALHFGLNRTATTFGTSVADFEPLNNFVNDDLSSKYNLVGALDLSLKIWSFPAMSGQVDLSINSGIGLNSVNIECDAFNVDSLVRDSLILLRYTDNELVLEYFNYFEPDLVGELDTSYIPISKNNISYKTFDVPVKIHVAWTPQKSLWSFFAEAGAIKRFIRQNKSDTYDNLLVNKSGEFVRFKADEFDALDLIRPVFSFGAERKIEPKSENSLTYLSLGGQFSAVLPATAFNRSSLFYTDVKSFSLSGFLRFHF